MIRKFPKKILKRLNYRHFLYGTVLPSVPRVKLYKQYTSYLLATIRELVTDFFPLGRRVEKLDLALETSDFDLVDVLVVDM